ncbi:hypothetical protein IFM89_014224 [Coptis chinensis]|uniref:Uncharacterized protein n=1 Tax=Coptis chinensis TaxID=261450 RepID=A0A835LM41_9MAGN|nr:hypothetical protein IFM89_014224 [Coptis chinensis]
MISIQTGSLSVMPSVLLCNSRNAGDGVDSAEDLGSFQPYPSTLPGILNGSARQLFQRLQGPMEEDTLKSHFECAGTTSSSLNSGSHTSGLPISNQRPTPPVHPTSGANSICYKDLLLPLSMKIVCHHHHAAFNTSSRDAQRYGVLRPASVSNNENQKMQPYNQIMLPSKNIQHSSMATPGSCKKSWHSYATWCK